jgi:hypothetical protein
VQAIATDATCGPLQQVCFEDYECRGDLREAIAATEYGPSAAHFEGRATLCQTSPKFQELYECIDAGDGVRAWRRSRCHAPDELIPPQCATLLTDLPGHCPGTDRLTATSASSYQCSEDCAVALTTAWTYCQTSFAALAQSQPSESREVSWLSTDTQLALN